MDFFSVILKRIEKASECAVPNALYARNSYLPGRLWSPMIDLGTSEQPEDHDEVYAEGERKHFFSCGVNSS
jgi:hypothetical protein